MSSSSSSSQSRTVALAFPWPAGVAFAALWIAAALFGVRASVEMIHEGGLLAIALVPLGLCAALVASAAVGLGLPRAVAVAAGLIPWIVGAAGGALPMRNVLAAIASVSAADKATLLAEGTAEVLAGRILGGVVAAGALFGVTIACAVRIPRDKIAALAGAGVALCAFVLALASVIEASSLREVLQALAHVAPTDRAVVMAVGGAEAQALHNAGLVVAALVALGAVACGVVAGRGQVPGFIVAAALVPLGLAADHVVVAMASAAANQLAVPPWADLAGFQPVVVDGDGAAANTPSCALAADGLRAKSDDGAALWVAYASSALHPITTSRGDHRVAEVLVDKRATPAAFAALVDAVLADRTDTEGGIDDALFAKPRSLLLVGAPPPPPPDLVRARAAYPLLAAIITESARARSVDVVARCAAGAVVAKPGAAWAASPASPGSAASLTIPREPSAPQPPADVATALDRAASDVPVCIDRAGVSAVDVIAMAGALSARHINAALGAPAPPPDVRPGEGGIASLLGDAGLFGSIDNGAVGFGGLGLRGTGAGGGGTGVGTLGLGSIGTIGHGSGTGSGFGRLGRASAATATGAPVVMGSLDKEVIRRVVQQHIAQVRYCYERSLEKKPTLEGTVKMRFVIGADGAVQDVSVDNDKLHDDDTTSCMLAKIKTWRFPAPTGGGIVIVNYPFTFRSVE